MSIETVGGQEEDQVVYGDAHVLVDGDEEPEVVSPRSSTDTWHASMPDTAGGQCTGLTDSSNPTYPTLSLPPATSLHLQPQLEEKIN